MATGEKSGERILFQLKTRGPRTAAQLAERLGMTPMGTRQHLAQLQQEGLVHFEEERRPVGRPVRVWSLSDKAHGRFPDGHADLTVEILAAVRKSFGASGMDKLVRARTREQLALYKRKLPAKGPLEPRVKALAKLRSEEGYMAECKRNKDGSFSLVENHCPICAAAELCRGLCAGEIELFSQSLGKGVRIERTEHLMEGARRCVYRIHPQG